MSIKKLLLMFIPLILVVSFVFAQGSDCPSYSQAQCQTSMYCKWSNGSCIWDDEKVNEIDEVEVVACADRTKIYNPETKKCELKKCSSCEILNQKTGKCEKAGIKLNTNVPFIGDCIAYGDTDTAGSETTKSNQITAFPKLMGALMNIVMTAVLIIGFLMIVVAGVMMTMGGYEAKNFQKGKEMIFKVGAVLALLGLSGVILKLINPTFFT